MISKNSFGSPPQNFRVVHYPDIADIPVESYLTGGELRQLAQKDSRKRAGYLASRYALKQVVQQYLPHIQPKDVEIRHGQDGVPKLVFHCLVSKRDYGVSLSHSGPYGAAAIGLSPDQRVGIDIERIRGWRKETLLAFLTAKEYYQVASQADSTVQNELATRYWSVKEAYLKGLGVGLRMHPQSVEVSFEPSQRVFSVSYAGQVFPSAAVQVTPQPGFVSTHVSWYA